MKYMVAAVVLGLMGQSAFAFEETTVGAGNRGAVTAPVLELPKDLPKSAEDSAKGLNLEMPLTPPGTEIRIPGLGKVGVLPKLDFGLELLRRERAEGHIRRQEQSRRRAAARHLQASLLTGRDRRSGTLTRSAGALLLRY